MDPVINKEQQAFTDYLKFEKRYARNTVDSYASDLHFFFTYLADQYEVAEVNEVQASMIRGWLASMKEQNQSAKSINRRISAVKSFYRFLERKALISINPTTMISAPKVNKRLPVYVEMKDMETLFRHIEFPDNWTGRLERLIFAIFYATGIRLSELTGMKESQVDLSKNQFKILGKGNKERVIPISAELNLMIQHYLGDKKTVINQLEGEYLLVNEKGKGLHPRYVQSVIKKYLEYVTTIEKKSPHVLRHSFATHLMNNGAELNAVKELLGHSSLAATQIYTHNTIEKLKDIHARAHPKS
ncbi:MAG: tyrosine-type recombinase/integrase [Bacteroidota bacterium]